MTSFGWYAVDLDGTLAHYVSWDGGKIGPPIPAMVARVKEWIASGMTVKIFTARVSGGPERANEVVQQREAIQDWCQQHLGARLEVTCRKDYAMIRLYDDRCIQVEPNTGRLIGVEEEMRTS
jgi:hypothetical protein